MKLRIISFIILIIYCTVFLSSCSILDPVLYETHLFKRSSEQIYKLAEKSVGEIVLYNKNNQALSFGTAFVYSSDGKMITNYHVIEDLIFSAYSATVTIGKNTYAVEKIVSFDADIDLAIIKVKAEGLEPLPLWYGEVNGGEKVYAVGSTKGLTLSFTNGVVASPNRVFDNVVYIQHDAAISNGNSGGPLFNEYGEVIGINSMGLKEGQNINFAISTKEIRNIKNNFSISLKSYNQMRKDAFEKLKKYAINNGTYKETVGETIMDVYSYETEVNRSISPMYSGINVFLLSYTYSSYIPDGSISLKLINNDYEVLISVTNAAADHYLIAYVEKGKDTLMGKIDLDTYTSNSTPEIYDESIDDYNIDHLNKMLSYLIDQLDTQFRDIGLSAYDLGFDY